MGGGGGVFNFAGGGGGGGGGGLDPIEAGDVPSVPILPSPKYLPFPRFFFHLWHASFVLYATAQDRQRIKWAFVIEEPVGQFQPNLAKSILEWVKGTVKFVQMKEHVLF